MHWSTEGNGVPGEGRAGTVRGLVQRPCPKAALHTRAEPGRPQQPRHLPRAPGTSARLPPEPAGGAGEPGAAAEPPLGGAAPRGYLGQWAPTARGPRPARSVRPACSERPAIPPLPFPPPPQHGGRGGPGREGAGRRRGAAMTRDAPPLRLFPFPTHAGCGRVGPRAARRVLCAAPGDSGQGKVAPEVPKRSWSKVATEVTGSANIQKVLLEKAHLAGKLFC